MELDQSDLAELRKNDERKALIARILMERTSVPQKWIVANLAMGSAPYVNRLAKEMGERIAAGDRAMKRLKKLIIARNITWPFFRSEETSEPKTKIHHEKAHLSAWLDPVAAGR